MTIRFDHVGEKSIKIEKAKKKKQFYKYKACNLTLS